MTRSIAWWLYLAPFILWALWETISLPARGLAQ